MATVQLPIQLSVRALEVTDLPDLEWSGGPQHITALATALDRSYAGEVDLEVIFAPNGRSIAVGAVDYRKRPGCGELWMLSVLDAWQSTGVGAVLITALEDRIAGRGLRTATLGVEHDNPRAAALYRRLGYRAAGTELDGWQLADGRSYATVCHTMTKDLPGPAAADR